MTIKLHDPDWFSSFYNHCYRSLFVEVIFSCLYSNYPKMDKFNRIFSKSLGRITAIGMIHLKSLPGSPRFNRLSIGEIVDHALHEAKLYVDHNIDGLMIENMNDVPYSLQPSPETSTIMTRVASEIKRETNLPLGVQVLASRNKEALAVALASNCNFIRVENFIYSHVADEGIVQSDAGELLRYRRQVSCDNVAIFTDIKKKHCSHEITSDITISEAAKTAEFFMSDGLILTGTSTGSPVEMSNVQEVASLNLEIPIIVGSGVNPENVSALFKNGVQAVIVGSYFKESGHWMNNLDQKRIKKFIDAVHNV